ncbi:ABC transporter permease [Calidifontibacter sp. DB0510]|uniref:ABC transporter permease n=1 Tax=Metallococcus carri TaxID=1656884 RepID=A0A967AY18_9MICO|nr:ABC transporter permease [Metallococcus carri]NHN55079.1 ABC transporter permease [Metallococcus carri]NOP36156.1 ABC transporter permease [Calidifontibacter sp. DB2511S]
MSTIASAATPHAGTRLPSRLAEAATTPIPFLRLLKVELRKLVDTRAGRWLLITIGALTLVVIGILLFTGKPNEGKGFGDFIAGTVGPQAVLLPILGILTVTSEWSQRTGLVTFTLEPRRLRVGLAKFLAALLVGFAAIIVGVAFAAVGTGLGALVRGSNPSWALSAGAFFGMFLAQAVGIAMGVGFGMLLRNTPGAIVAYFFLPTLWSIVSSISFMKTAGEWLDTNKTLAPVFDGSMSGEQWAHFLVSTLVWAVLPLAVGMWRMTRAEVKSA